MQVSGTCRQGKLGTARSPPHPEGFPASASRAVYEIDREVGTLYFLWSMLVGEPSQKKGEKGHYWGT